MRLKTLVLLFLCPIFRALAQQAPIKIGDKVPDVTITNVTGLQIRGKSVSSFQMAQLRGQLVILDFWATWCAPCRAMVPRMDSLQREFGSSIQFLPITYEPARTAMPVLAAIKRQRDFSLPEVTGDTIVEKLFPHRALPHYVWIDTAGRLIAATEYKEVNAANIRSLLNGIVPAFEVKQDTFVAYNADKPLLVGGNGGDASSLKYHALLTGYLPGVNGGLHITPYDPFTGQAYSVTNVPFTWLCRLAFSENGRWFPDTRIRLETRDSAAMTTTLTGQAYDRWLASGNGYCYELLLPPALTGKPFTFMQQDLTRLFPQYHIAVERRSIKTLALVRTSGTDKLKSAGGPLLVNIGPFACELRNSHLSQLVMRLDRLYLQKSPLPVTDETGYSGRVDLTLDARLSDVASLNTALAKYDLRLEQRESVAELLVVRDQPLTN